MIDEVGIGAGVLDTLKQDKKFITTGINGGSRSDDPNKYGNLRAQIFDGLRQRFADGQISIPNDPELISQLASLTYRYNARGQLLLESKEIIKGHGRQSPDKADALAYAFAEHRATKREWGIITYTPKTLARLREHNAATPDGATNNNSPPSLREGGREHREQGDARNSPQYPPTSFPRTRETSGNSKARHSPPHSTVGAEHPLHRNTPSHNNVPSPASHSPTPPRGRLRGGPRVRATGRPWGAGHHPNHHPLHHRNNPLSHHPILPILSNLSHPSSGVSQSTPISKCPLFS